MDFSISEEQRAFVDTVRRVCQTGFKERALKYLDGTWPAENMKELADIGVLGMSVPQEYGGSGLGILDTVLVLEEIGKVCYVTAMAALGELGVQTRVISTYAPESIKRQAFAFEDAIRSLVLDGMKRAISSDRTTLYNKIRRYGLERPGDGSG